MELNTVIAKLALEYLGKFRSDSSLFDAIVNYDIPLVKYLVNNRYKSEIINRGYVKESISIAKMIQEIEANLNKNKPIRLIN